MKKKISLTLLGLSIISLIGTIVSAVIYFINSAKISGIEFLEAAAHSVQDAKKMLDFTGTMGWMTIILIIVTVLLIGATVVMFVLCKKSKPKQEDKQNESNQQ